MSEIERNITHGSQDPASESTDIHEDSVEDTPFIHSSELYARQQAERTHSTDHTSDIPWWKRFLPNRHQSDKLTEPEALSSQAFQPLENNPPSHHVQIQEIANPYHEEKPESVSQNPRAGRIRRWTSLQPKLPSVIGKSLTVAAIAGSLSGPLIQSAEAEYSQADHHTSDSSITSRSNKVSYDHGVTFSNETQNNRDLQQSTSEDTHHDETANSDEMFVDTRQNALVTDESTQESSIFPVDSFQDTFEKTKDAERIWGDALTVNMREAYKYKDGTTSVRPVKYFSKGRMEINPEIKEYHSWSVTSGLLVKEMIDGKIQVGDNEFIDSEVSTQNIVGDPDAGNITYESISKANKIDEHILQPGEIVSKTVNLDGVVTNDPRYAEYNVETTNFVPETGHAIAAPLWESMVKDSKNYNDNPFYHTGYPISEPYWTTAMINGEMRDVLVQAFQRRTLTFTPDNREVAPDFVVEAGNAGLHYVKWRYNPVEAQRDEQVNVMEYFVPDNLETSVDGSLNISTVRDENKNRIYFVKGSGKSINGVKYSGSYELYEETGEGIYLREDHSNGDDKYYAFTEGLFLKKNMKIGESIESPDNVVNFYDNNGTLSESMPFPIKVTLLDKKEIYLGGDLGTQECLVYAYNWGPVERPFTEVFYMSAKYGWVQWELYNQDGILENNAILNQVVNSVTHPMPSARE